MSLCCILRKTVNVQNHATSYGRVNRGKWKQVFSLTLADPLHLLVEETDHVPVGILPPIGLDHPPHVSRILLHRPLGKLAGLRVRLADVPQILVQDEELAVVLADQFPATISLAMHGSVV